MALKARLFAGDQKLEAALVSDPAHIVKGASGEHVRKIQVALIRLDSTTIKDDGIFGARTEAAVLAFKQKRDIVNRSYQSQADGIVGKLTMAALDQEMAALESRTRITVEGSLCRFATTPIPNFRS
jgi:peptidoglycan hydrolase-like protein with peptidoglycan-binding domain